METTPIKYNKNITLGVGLNVIDNYERWINMVLKIDPAAREYLQQKGSKAVTVHVEYSGGG